MTFQPSALSNPPTNRLGIRFSPDLFEQIRQKGGAAQLAKSTGVELGPTSDVGQSSSSGPNWLLIGGVSLAGLLAIGGAVYFVRRRSKPSEA